MENQKNDNTGFKQVGFRPVAGHIAVILTQDHIDGFDADKEKPASLNIKSPKLFAGEKLEHEKKEKEATFIVACVSKSVAANEDAPEVGDRIAVLNGTPINEFFIDKVKYGIIPLHKVACIISHEAKVSAE